MSKLRTPTDKLSQLPCVGPVHGPVNQWNYYLLKLRLESEGRIRMLVERALVITIIHCEIRKT